MFVLCKHQYQPAMCLTCDANMNASFTCFDNITFYFWLDIHDSTFPKKMSASLKYRCNYCSKGLPTIKGVCIHVSQWHACRETLQRAASKSKLNNLNNSNEDGIQPSDQLPSQEETNRSMLFDQDFPADLPQLDGDNPSSSSQWAHVEEVEDEEAGGSPD